MAKKICVTGATSFIGRHIVKQALAEGYSVMGTARNSQKCFSFQNEINHQKFRCHNADLMASWGWQAAMTGCRAVIHCASPYPLRQPSDESDVIDPAVKGVKNVLKSAIKSGVKRLVLTSSCAAIGYGHTEDNRFFDETCWTDMDAGLGAYVKSKTLAEQAAWDTVRNHPEFELVVINPQMVLGPSIGQKQSASIDFIRLLLAGKYLFVPKLSVSPVDVRDVAAAHLAALSGKRAVGRRFLVTGDSMWMSELAEKLKVHSSKTSSRELPIWLSKRLARFDPNVGGLISEWGLMRHYDSLPAQKILKFTPRPLAETLSDMLDSLDS